MSIAVATRVSSDSELSALIDETCRWADSYQADVTASVRTLLSVGGRIDRTAFDRHQHEVHGLAWVATYAQTFRQVAAWRERQSSAGRFGDAEELLLRLLFCEYSAQLVGGLPMNQGETVRPADFGLSLSAHIADLWRARVGQSDKTALADLVAASQGRASVEDAGLDETMTMIRDQFSAFAAEKVTPFAHGWHLRDELIPLELVKELGELGVFGLTIPETFGGSGLGKMAMCVVSEVLSRGYIGVGSLGTRSEIAAELILTGGTDEQKAHWLPKIASAEILPTAVFTEPNTGSDLGSLRTRAALTGETYVVSGAKTWITHAARAVGVAQAALEEGLAYALTRQQFGGPIFSFPRVHNKLAMMAAEIMGVRQLTYFAALEKDQDRRCDLEAGMAKLLAARVAWASADNALQIHGGNGFALEYPISRILCDARILNIFEGAGEIQAQVIARRLLEDGRNG